MKLAAKLTLSFLLVSLIAIGLAAGVIWGTTSFEFNRFLQQQRLDSFFSAASAYYAQNSSWNGVERSLRQQGLLPPPGANPAPPFALLDEGRRVIVPSGTMERGQIVGDYTRENQIPIIINGKTVGFVLDTGQPFTRNPVEQQYVDRINTALLVAGLGGSIMALVLGFVLAGTLTRPVKELTQATRAVARGEMEGQVPVRSQDELGELAAAFNQMSADLARSNQARRQMTADIAHDLRNPLTVIGGYLEGLQDGVLKPSPERFQTMNNELQHLKRLVEDLRTLSLADAGELVIHKQAVQVRELLERLKAAYEHAAQQQNITITLDGGGESLEVDADAERMEQVLGNLVSNALRYTGGQEQGGMIRLAAVGTPGGVEISVQDNGSGIAPDVLPHIFERSYRADPAREGNESGLGLAIARSIVEIHGGTIRAESEGAGKGTRFVIVIPAR